MISRRPGRVAPSRRLRTSVEVRARFRLAWKEAAADSICCDCSIAQHREIDNAENWREISILIPFYPLAAFTCESQTEGIMMLDQGPERSLRRPSRRSAGTPKSRAWLKW